MFCLTSTPSASRKARPTSPSPPSWNLTSHLTTTAPRTKETCSPQQPHSTSPTLALATWTASESSNVGPPFTKSLYSKTSFLHPEQPTSLPPSSSCLTPLPPYFLSPPSTISLMFPQLIQTEADGASA